MSGDIPYHAEMLMTYLYQHATPEQLTSARWHCQKIIDAASPTPTNDGEGLMIEALRDAREAILSLDEDALGSFVDPHTGEPIYPLRAELLDKIARALNQGAGQ